MELTVENDERGDMYKAAMLTDEGWRWIEENESKFVLRKPPKGDQNDIDDDIPF